MKDKVVQILINIRPEFDFNDDVNFIETGMLDSFDIVTLVTSLDEEFGISIDGTEILPENFCTIGAIIQLLSRYNIQ
jgi:acyl carrier protein